MVFVINMTKNSFKKSVVTEQVLFILDTGGNINFGILDKYFLVMILFYFKPLLKLFALKQHQLHTRFIKCRLFITQF